MVREEADVCGATWCRYQPWKGSAEATAEGNPALRPAETSPNKVPPFAAAVGSHASGS